MPSNQTANYALSQWERTDQVRMEDFNADNAKIDAALGDHAAALAALTAAAPHWGNCQIYTTTYTGTGQYGEEHPSTLTFPKKPLLVIITESGYDSLHIFPFNTSYTFGGYATITVKITWSGSTVTWSASTSAVQMNNATQTYHVIAFYPMD